MKRKHSQKKGKKARRSKGPGLKRADYKPKDATVYKGYDISALPKEAWPDETKTNAGKQSYTLTHKDCAIEVLLKHNAFFCETRGRKGPWAHGPSVISQAWRSQEGLEVGVHPRWISSILSRGMLAIGPR